MKNNNKNKGFSLVELLIYIGIFAASATFLVGVLVIFTRVQVSQSSMNAVNSQVSFVNSFVQERVRSSSLIDMPAGVSTSTLTLRMASSTLDPTLIYWDEGNQAVFLKEGVGSPAALTDSSVNVTNFSVIKYTNPGGHDVAQISMSIDFDTENDRAKYQRSIQTSISRVSAATFDSDGLPNADDTFDLGNATYKWRNIYLSNNAYIDGNVGIGTTGPTEKLVVLGGDILVDNNMDSTLYLGKGAEGVDGVTKIKSYQSGADTDELGLQFYVHSNTSGSSLAEHTVTIDHNGNVGIGTTTPSTRLHVEGSNPRIMSKDSGTSWATLQVGTDMSDNHGYLIAYGSDQVIAGEVALKNALNHPLTFYTNATERVRIDKDGNVGIGTTAPGTKLDVYNGAIRARTNTNTSYFVAQKPDAYSLTGFKITDGTDDTIYMRDQGSAAGRVGVYSSNGRDLDIKTELNLGKTLKLQGSIVNIVDADTPYDSMLYAANGNVGIGTTAPAATLDVNGSLSKTSGSFDIKHPNPLLAQDGYRLRHYFVESPTAGDNIYRFEVNIVNREAIIDLPDYFQYLNENSQVWVSPVDSFGSGYGVVNSELTEATIKTNQDGKYNVLIIGTRKDEAAVDYFNEKGVEYQVEE